MKRIVFSVYCCASGLLAQEANSGFELRTTLTAEAVYSHRLSEAPRLSVPWTGGIRAMLYPTWKISRHWTASGAVQLSTRPYFFEQLPSQGRGVRADILQAHLCYSRFWGNNSIAVRVGELSSAFGSFLLHYDDAANPLIDMPLMYGYYYKPVTTYSLAGGQVDATLGKLDLRAQFSSSSPGNRRSIFDRDQYANWTGGVGYTIVQGWRVGASAYRGPYLYRGYPYYFPGEAAPKDLPAAGYGVDVQWARGAWTIDGELARFDKAYRLMPTFRQETGYIELRRVLDPRWQIAARVSFMRPSAGERSAIYEAAAGFRPNQYQLLKLGYQRTETPNGRGALDDVVAVQLVTAFRAMSIARD